MKKTIPYKENTQKFLIVNHLKNKKSISQVEAAEVYKIRRLAARIYELKNEGWNIKPVMKKDMTGQKYARYFLKKPFKMVFDSK